MENRADGWIHGSHGGGERQSQQDVESGPVGRERGQGRLGARACSWKGGERGKEVTFGGKEFAMRLVRPSREGATTDGGA